MRPRIARIDANQTLYIRNGSRSGHLTSARDGPEASASTRVIRVLRGRQYDVRGGQERRLIGPLGHR